MDFQSSNKCSSMALHNPNYPLFIASASAFVIFPPCLLACRPRLVRSTENRQHTIDVDDKHAIVMLELDWDGFARIEENFVVLANGLIFVVFDRLADRYDTAGDDRDLMTVGQHNAAFCLAFVFILAHDDALADGLDDVIFKSAS